MTEEHRITPEMAAEARAEMERALKSDSAISEFDLFGNKMVLERRPDGGVIGGVPGHPVVSQLIPSAHHRPQGIRRRFRLLRRSPRS